MAELKRTYCRICEPLCGLLATVEHGELIQVRPDPDHPVSAGFACQRGLAMPQVVNDPDRVLYPLRRKAGTKPGAADLTDYERVTWDEALDDIATRVRAIVGEHGGSGVGCYAGNPLFFSYSAAMWARGFLDALGSPHFYAALSQDGGSRFAASALLYGSTMRIPVPDVGRTDFLLMVGANPLLSQGSYLSARRLGDQLRAIPKRGGRVVVLDPRRTETARVFEHVFVRPDSDAWLLLAMLHVIFEEGLADLDTVSRQARGTDWLRWCAANFSPDGVATATGVAPEVIRELARAFARSDSAVAYGRVGSNRGRHGTLVAFLIDALTIVTGNLDRVGGALFGLNHFPGWVLKAADTFGSKHTRIGNFPDVYGILPSNVMAQEITTPGSGQLRALFTLGGNPILSAPDTGSLGSALQDLDLHVAVDFYLSETARYANYVLPATTFYEREDLAVGLEMFHLTPSIEYTDAVIAPRGEARQEWQIIDEIARRSGFYPSSSGLVRRLSRIGIRPSPLRIADALLRLGPHGDFFGLRRRGVSVAKLRGAAPRQLADHLPTGHLRRKIRHRDRLVRLDPPEIVAEVEALGRRNPADQTRFPLVLIGLREKYTHNTWMHNAPKLMSGTRSHAARINPGDAAEAGIQPGDLVRVSSATGAIEVAALITAEVMPGAVAIPFGWGHGASMSTAHAAGGVNVNALVSARVEDIEPVAGMTFLDGLPIRIEPALSGIDSKETTAQP